jgi:heptosyltransferase-2
MKKKLAFLVYSSIFGIPRKRPGLKTPDLSSLKRIMVVRNDKIGDLICSLPAFEALRKACPQAEITLVASTYNPEVAEGNPYIDKILCYEKYKHSNTSFRLISVWRQYRFLRRLRKMRFDLAIGLRAHFSKTQSLIVFASGAPYRLGHNPKRRRYKPLAFFYNLYVPNSRAEKHEVQRSLDVVRTLGVDLENPKPLLVINQDELDFAQRILKASDIKGSPVIGYHISNYSPSLVWSLENFAGVIRLLKAKYPDSEHLITFAPDKMEDALKLKGMLRDSVHIIKTPTIKKLGALQRHCQLFITLDGAPMHLAAAMDIPTVALFKGFYPVVWRPWCKHYRCLSEEADINDISVQDVFTAATEMLSDQMTSS